MNQGQGQGMGRGTGRGRGRVRVRVRVRVRSRSRAGAGQGQGAHGTLLVLCTRSIGPAMSCMATKTAKDCSYRTVQDENKTVVRTKQKQNSAK